MKPASVLSIALMLSLSGCSKPQQAFTPAGEKLVPVYSELLLLSEEFKSASSGLDSTGYQKEVQSVLSRNGLTREEFANRVTALAQSPELFQQFHTKVRDNFKHRKSEQSL